MNRAFRLVWSKRLNALVVASEITKGRGKGGTQCTERQASGALTFSLNSIASAIRGVFSGKAVAVATTPLLPLTVVAAFSIAGSLLTTGAHAQTVLDNPTAGDGVTGYAVNDVYSLVVNTSVTANTTGVFLDGDNTNPLFFTVTANGTVRQQGDPVPSLLPLAGVVLTNTTAVTVTTSVLDDDSISRSIYSEDGVALVINDVYNLKSDGTLSAASVTITNGGFIESQGNQAILIGGNNSTPGVTAINSYTTVSPALDKVANASVSITNSGEIVARGNAIEISGYLESASAASTAGLSATSNAGSGQASLILINSGNIESATGSALAVFGEAKSLDDAAPWSEVIAYGIYASSSVNVNITNSGSMSGASGVTFDGLESGSTGARGYSLYSGGSSSFTFVNDSDGELNATSASGFSLLLRDVYAQTSSNATITNEGNISSAGSGVVIENIWAESSDNFVRITNNGSVSAVNDALRVQNIHAGDDALVRIVNNGLIESTAGRAVAIYGVDAIGDAAIGDAAIRLINESDIRGSTSGVTIEGVSGTTPSVRVTNDGNITAAAGVGLKIIDVESLDDSGDVNIRVANSEGALISGTSWGVEIFDISADKVANVSLVNAGNITGGVNISGVESYDSDLDLAEALARVTVNNFGRIDEWGIIINNVSATAFAEDLDGADNSALADVLVTNNGTIQSDTGAGISVEDVSADNLGVTGVSEARVVVSNNESVTALSGSGVFVDGVEASTSSVTVTNAGFLSAGEDGIEINDVFGNVTTVTVVNTVDGNISADDNGITIRGVVASTNVSVSLTNSGIISSNSSAAFAVSVGDVSSSASSLLLGSGVVVANDGLGARILGFDTGSGAVRVDLVGNLSNGVLLTNEGLISGRVELTNIVSTATFDNSGIWRVRDGEDSSRAFDANGTTGLVELSNTGTIEVTGNATFSGLTTFNNSGLIDITADAAEEGVVYSTLSLNFKGSTFNGQEGSLIALDALLGDARSAEDNFSVSDVVIFDADHGLNVTIDGQTGLVIRDSNPSLPGVNNPTGSVLVAWDGEDSFGSPPYPEDGVFYLAGGPINKGLWQYDLFATEGVTYNATTGVADADDSADKVWRLASTPSHHAFELPVMMTAAQEAWHRSASVITDRFSELRAKREEASSPKSGLWAKVVGAQQQRDLKNSYALYGRTLDFKTDYDQSIYGLLLGLDHVINTGDDSRWLLGVSGGILRSNTKFDTTATKMDYDITSVGLYASYSSGGAFFNALVKQDSGDTDYSMSNRKLNSDGGIRYSEKFDTRVLGGALEAGYRFLGQNGFFEPSIRVATATAKVKDREFLATDVDFENGKSTRSSLSLTSGYTTTWQGSKAEPYLQISLINESGADNKVRLTSGGQDPVTVKDGDLGTMGQVAVGLRVFGSKGSHGYLRADYTGNSDTKSYSISGGLKWNW